MSDTEKPKPKSKPPEAVPGKPADPAPAPDSAQAPFTTAADAFKTEADTKAPTSGLSFTPGLREVANSPVPGAAHSHVLGPQQAAADPVAAGLDTAYAGRSRAENRVVNKTGEQASGPRTLLPEHPPEDGRMEPAPGDDDAAGVPGPSGGGKDA